MITPPTSSHNIPQTFEKLGINEPYIKRQHWVFRSNAMHTATLTACLVKEIIDRNRKSRYNIPSGSTFACHVIIVPKKEGSSTHEASHRKSVDFRSDQ